MPDFTNPVLFPGSSSLLKEKDDIFKTITPEDMVKIAPFLQQEKGRTTDFTNGGILMWVEFFNYKYCIHDDTLFIKGVVENDRTTPAFSLPLGKLTIKESIDFLKDINIGSDHRLTFSAVPEYAVDEFKKAGAREVEELTDWGDYLYDAEKLATLTGKKYSKKRNHVNQFYTSYPRHDLIELTSGNISLALAVMDEFEKEADNTFSATAERILTRNILRLIETSRINYIGAILIADDKPCAFTIGEIKGDTLFIHIEKALRGYHGSYETINKEFAAMIRAKNPNVKYINREDDGGDEGLRKAKESYHPLTILKKYNIRF